MSPLAQALLIADELHIPISCVHVTPESQLHPRSASLRLKTINPTVFLARLQQESILSPTTNITEEGETYA